jgi:hypothetical protein
MSAPSPYAKAWFAYFRADAEFDDAKAAYIAAFLEDESSTATAALYNGA